MRQESREVDHRDRPVAHWSCLLKPGAVPFGCHGSDGDGRMN